MNKRNILPVNNISEIKNFIEYIQTVDLDDEELEIVKKFLDLEIYLQNLILLKSKGHSLREMGQLLDVSYQWVNQHLKSAYKKLKE